ncbi:hypothetical protein PBCVAP110A_852R [Paramecium bursaria Chlorella virus AP110A]|nr:hypothetical protein PBCVAP110A_852R [Paramecium bursaria Chlorella virus AP110A]
MVCTTGDLDFWNGLSTGDLDFWNGLTTGDLDFWNGLSTGDAVRGIICEDMYVFAALARNTGDEDFCFL